MTRQTLIFILTVSTALFGCNIDSRVKQSVGDSIKDTKIDMNWDIANAKSSFMESCKRASGKSKDSMLKTKINDLYFSITKTSEYIDSLRSEMNGYNDMDLNNSDFSERVFLNLGIGDSVFNKVKLSYSLAIDIAISDTTKSRLKSVRGNFTEKTKTMLFEIGTPLMVNMVLYGIESELIKDGIRSLYGYETSNKPN